MAVTISRTDAEVIAGLALEDLRGYATRYPEAHAEFLKRKNSKMYLDKPKGERTRRTHRRQPV